MASVERVRWGPDDSVIGLVDHVTVGEDGSVVVGMRITSDMVLNMLRDNTPMLSLWFMPEPAVARQTPPKLAESIADAVAEATANPGHIVEVKTS